MHAVKIGSFVVACCLALTTRALAQSTLNAAASMHDNLSLLSTSKQAITVVLKNGTSYRAKIGSVGDHHVVLTEPYQKEFFDVLIPIDEIAAVEVRVREK